MEPPRDPVVGGVLVRLSDEPERRERAIEALVSHPAITMGPKTGTWWPLAVVAENASEGRDLHAWLATLPGVEWVEVVSVYFEGMSDDETKESAMEVMA